jgi:hypothetical protein
VVEPIRFASGAAPVTIWFDVKISADAMAKLAASRVDRGVKEGDVVLF